MSGEGGPDGHPGTVSLSGPTIADVVLVDNRHKFGEIQCSGYGVYASLISTLTDPLSPQVYYLMSDPRKARSTKPTGFRGWNRHPARESPTPRTQEECLVDCEFCSIPMTSIHLTEVSTTGMRQKVGVICIPLGMYSMAFVSHTLHVNPTVVT